MFCGLLIGGKKFHCIISFVIIWIMFNELCILRLLVGDYRYADCLDSCLALFILVRILFNDKT